MFFFVRFCVFCFLPFVGDSGQLFPLSSVLFVPWLFSSDPNSELLLTRTVDWLDLKFATLFRVFCCKIKIVRIRGCSEMFVEHQAIQTIKKMPTAIKKFVTSSPTPSIRVMVLVRSPVQTTKYQLLLSFYLSSWLDKFKPSLIINQLFTPKKVKQNKINIWNCKKTDLENCH